MLGLILLLVLKVCSSDAVEATVGSTITLECTASWSSYQWQQHLETHWSSTIENSSKYGNANSAFLTIYNIDIDDAGTYRCITPGYPMLEINLTVTAIVNGNWGEWRTWSACSTTCGSGTWTRSRSCDNPAPANGGSYCSGLDHETTKCAKPSCPVNGRWSEWEAWSTCSTTCGSGTWTRYRSCDNPEPANDGSYCSGLDYETTQCIKPSCPVHGNWGAWHDWNSCSTTCGSGSRSRYQQCNDPEPSNGGLDCQGNDTEIESCSIKLCPVPSEEDNSSASVGIGAGIGSTVVVIGLLIGFFVILRRCRLGKPAESAIYTTAGDTESSNADLHIYSGLQQNTASPTDRQNGVIYDNLIIWKKANSC